jgi:hypothetical protein
MHSYIVFSIQQWTEQEDGRYEWSNKQDFNNELEARRIFARLQAFNGTDKITVLEEK